MILDKFHMLIDHDMSLISPVVTPRIGLFIGKKMHELEFDAQMIHPFMNISRQFDSKRLIKARDIAHDMGLSEDVIISKKRFVGRAIEGDDITKDAAMFGLQVG